MRRTPAAIAAFARDCERGRFASSACVRAGAKLHRIAVQRFRLPADLHHADSVAVFVAEKLHDVAPRRALQHRAIPIHDTGEFSRMRSLTSFSTSRDLRRRKRLDG